MRKFLNKGFKTVGSATALVLGAAGSASAAVPVTVTTAMTDGATDAAAVAALSLLVVIGVAVVKYMRRGV